MTIVANSFKFNIQLYPKTKWIVPNPSKCILSNVHQPTPF